MTFDLAYTSGDYVDFTGEIQFGGTHAVVEKASFRLINDGLGGGVLWYGGTWHDGFFAKGAWFGGDWMKGTWKFGTWKDGTWHGGTWINGIWMGGTWLGGDWMRGLKTGHCEDRRVCVHP